MCWGATRAGEPVCTARMFEEQPGVWHIGRVATYAARRGRGYAGAMMREMCREAAARGGKTASLGAQVERQSFYEALGFSPVGEVFLDCGQPHIEMRRALCTAFCAAAASPARRAEYAPPCGACRPKPRCEGFALFKRAQRRRGRVQEAFSLPENIRAKCRSRGRAAGWQRGKGWNEHRRPGGRVNGGRALNTGGMLRAGRQQGLKRRVQAAAPAGVLRAPALPGTKICADTIWMQVPYKHETLRAYAEATEKGGGFNGTGRTCFFGATGRGCPEFSRGGRTPIMGQA